MQDLQLQAVQSALQNNTQHVCTIQEPRPKELNPCVVQPHLKVVQSEHSPDLCHAADLFPPSKTLCICDLDVVEMEHATPPPSPRKTAPEPTNGVHPVPPSGLYLDWWRKASESVCYVEQSWNAAFKSSILKRTES